MIDEALVQSREYFDKEVIPFCQIFLWTCKFAIFSSNNIKKCLRKMSILNDYEEISNDNFKFCFELCLIFVAPFHYKETWAWPQGRQKGSTPATKCWLMTKNEFFISACHLFWNCSWILRNVVNILLVCSNFR